MSAPQRLPSGRWRIRWVDANGERQSATFATKDLARTELRRLEVRTDEDKISRKRLGLAGVLTVAQAGERFLANRKRGPQDTERRFLSRGETYTDHFEMHIKPHIGHVKLCELTAEVLRDWIDKLVATKTHRRGEDNETARTLSASTIRGIITTLRQIAKASNVKLDVMMPDSLRQKRRRHRPKALQCIEDVHALLRGCERVPWFKIAAAIACYAGARLGEIASLRWRHIGEQTITIALSWEGPLKARYEDDEDAARVVPLDPELAEVLKAWRAVTNGGADDHVVLVGGRRPLQEKSDDMAALTRAACKRAGLAPLTFHSLRATYATIAASQNLPIGSLQALLGHADMKTTAVYIRPESTRAALDPRARIGGGHKMDTTPDRPAALPN